MTAYFLARVSLASSFCCLLGVLGSGSSLAQSEARGSTSGGCAGVLCSLTPGSMDRPILADEARRMEAERDNRSAIDAMATPAGDGIRRHRAAHRLRHEAVAPSRHALDGRSVAARSTPVTRRPDPIVAAPAAPAEGVPDGPINAIFVLAPRPFDPYGGDYAPWLDRLAWPSRADRAGDRTVFSADGYDVSEAAPTSAAQVVDDLSRRSNALSERGFQVLKSDLGGS